MKFAKVLSVAAAAAAVTAAISCSAGAELTTSTVNANGLTTATGMWLMKLYVPSESIDAGIDCTQIGSVVFTVTAADPDFFEGQTGGGVVMSCGPASICPSDHNWASKGYWGVVDEALGIDTHDAAQPIQTTKVGDYTYEIACTVDDTNCIYQEAMDSADGYVQIALQEWGSDMSAMTVVSMDVLDASGNSMIKYDGDGNIISGDAAAPAEDTAPADTDAPAPAATPDKGSPDTGVEGIAAAAGLALVAAGAVAISRKRK